MRLASNWLRGSIRLPNGSASVIVLIVLLRGWRKIGWHVQSN